MTRRTLTLVPLLVFGFLLSLAAQPASPPTDLPQASNSAMTDKKQKEEVSAEPVAVTTFDERAAAEVLGVIRNGLEGHSQRRFLSAFDADKMEGFLTFEDQLEAYFTRYEAFRVTLRILQTSEENNRGVILVQFQLENEPRGGGHISRREGPLRFELVHGPKGWKIVDFNPRGFFS